MSANKKSEEVVRKTYDSIGLAVADYLEQEGKKKQWMADELEISHVTLMKKMRDNQEWTKSQVIHLQFLGINI
jgi:transcriptional regulator with PAS, ATPase and Fis domain